jgi:hypothetical protein
VIVALAPAILKAGVVRLSALLTMNVPPFAVILLVPVIRPFKVTEELVV